ncbi:DUF4351 domain-containing protein [Candidatus Viridilinea mediisalina]|uniref:DUF4351 domain-containing protein n=1 Tax=Candidatus Viridilinea mediisalina TaxID=2024553 RepID=UPI000F5AA9FE|nr:DUF4351 domain-containing protein [Candidatus Viridilinea mediisalina]
MLDVDRAMLDASSNPVAMVVLLHRDAQETRGKPEERMQRKLAHFRSFFRKGYRAEDLRLLYRLLDQLLRLNEYMNEQVRATMHQIEQEEVEMDTFVTSIEELAAKEGEARGLVKGLTQGQAALLLHQVERRFGPPPPEVQQRVATLAADELLALAEALFVFASMDDVKAWLKL